MSYVLRDYEQVDVFTPGDSTVHIRARLYCTTVSDLPAPTDIPGFTLEAGSTAWLIGDVVCYMLDTGGAWREQRSADLSAIITDISQIRGELQAHENRIDAAENRITALEAAAALLIDSGAKNILPISNPLSSETKRGITATYDFSAGTITLNGTHDGTGDAVFYLYTGAAADQKVIPAGSYHLSGCPAGGSTETYCLIVQNVGGTPAYKLDTGSGQDFTITSDGRMAPIIRVKKPDDQTVSFNNAVFAPMICLDTYWKFSQAFVPCSPSNAELYQMIRSYHP